MEKPEPLRMSTADKERVIAKQRRIAPETLRKAHEAAFEAFMKVVEEERTQDRESFLKGLAGIQARVYA